MIFNRRHFIGAALVSTLLPARAQAEAPVLTPVAEGFNHPWGMAFISETLALITERSGQLRLVDLTRGDIGTPLSGLPDIYAEGQGGLLDVALAPDFKETREIYLSFSEPQLMGAVTAVFRAKLSQDSTRLEEGQTIFRQNMIARGGRHFGSRLVFDQTGHLFVTTGDRGNGAEEAQNPENHLGKLLRLARDGSPAKGNPNKEGWAPEIWSIGHRNLQGAALHPQTGAIWTVEHGAQGGDELNRPEKGKNYGWPRITYGRDYSGAKIGIGTTADGLEQPIHYWDPSIAPSGMIFVKGSRYPKWSGDLLIGALAGQHIVRLRLSNNRVVSEDRYFEDVARFRALVQSPNGLIYVLTDNAKPYGGLYYIKPF